MKKLVIGTALLVIGTLCLLWAMGYFQLIDMPRRLALIPEGKIGINMRSEVVYYPYPLATVVPGETYEWKVSVSNTGDITWEDSSCGIRVLVPEATKITRTCAACPAECHTCGWTGNCVEGYDVFEAGKVTIAGKTYCDHVYAREPIENATWNIHFRNDTTWYKIDDPADEFAVFRMYEFPARTSRDYHLRLTIPTGASGTYWLLVDCWARVGEIYVFDYDSDTFTVGVIDGTVVLTFIGAITLSAGVATLALYFFKPW